MAARQSARVCHSPSERVTLPCVWPKLTYICSLGQSFKLESLNKSQAALQEARADLQTLTDERLDLARQMKAEEDSWRTSRRRREVSLWLRRLCSGKLSVAVDKVSAFTCELECPGVAPEGAGSTARTPGCGSRRCCCAGTGFWALSPTTWYPANVLCELQEQSAPATLEVALHSLQTFLAKSKLSKPVS